MDSKQLNSLLWMSAFSPVDGYGCTAEPLIEALLRAGVNVDAKAIWLDDRRGLKETTKIMLKKKIEETYDAAICFSTPGHYKLLKPHTAFRIGWGMHESSTTVPKHPTWVSLINKHCDAFIVPAQFSQFVFTRDGVKIPVSVVPLGVEKRVVKPRERKDRPFTFFTYGVLNFRKAPEYVMQCFKNAFPRGDENVRLVMKTVRGAFGLFNTFQVPDIRITVINAQWTRNRLNDFMAEEVDAGIWLCRGEGFNLPPLEAMAASLPVILANNSGNSDFTDSRYCLPVPNDEMNPTSPCPMGGVWFNPDWTIAVRQMRWCYEHQDEAYELGLKASEWAMTNWTWDHTAKKLVDTINALRGAVI